MADISIIVPVYQVEPYLRRCVDSILNQTFSDFELILVDDGSPDNCGAICDEYAQMDNRVVVIHQENGGLSAARNAGIDWAFANSDSQWLAFVDSDDWVHKDYLHIMYNAAVSKKADICQCAYQKVWDQHVEDEIVLDRTQSSIVTGFEAQYRRHGIDVYIWNKLYKKKIWSAIRFPVGVLYEDTFTTYQLTYAANLIVKTQSRLYYYYQSENSITRNNNSAQEAFNKRYLYIFYNFQALISRQRFYMVRGHLDLAKAESIRTESYLSEELKRKENCSYSRKQQWRIKQLYWKLVFLSFSLWSKKFWIQRCIFAISPKLLEFLYNKVHRANTK